MSAHTNATAPAFSIRQLAADALQRDINHELSQIAALDRAMKRMTAGKRLDQAEAQWNKRLDRVTALHEEQERML